jgi:hypothetical protein
VSRARWFVLVAVVCVCLGVSGGYFVIQRRTVTEPIQAAAVQPPADAGLLLSAPRIVFRDTTPGASYSTVAVVALADPSGPRADLPLRCERVYATVRSRLRPTSWKPWTTGWPHVR